MTILLFVMLVLFIWVSWVAIKNIVMSYAVLLFLIGVAAATYTLSRNIVCFSIPFAGILAGWVVALVVGLLPSLTPPVVAEGNMFSLLFSFQAAGTAISAGRIVAILTTLFLSGRIILESDSDLGVNLKLTDNPALGTAKWGTWRTLSKQAAAGWPSPGESGVVVGRLQGRVMQFRAVPPISPHVLVIGGTGSGKSTGYIMPNIFAAGLAGESVVVSDPKGELLGETGGWLQQQGYNVVVFDLLSSRGYGWNPVQAARDEKEVDILCDTLIRNAVSDAGGEKSYFFALEKTALIAVVEYVKQLPGQDNMLSVMSLLAQPQHVLGQLIKNYGSQAARHAWGQVEGAKTSPLVGLSAKLNVLRYTESLLVPSCGGIDFGDLKREKTALFCILPIGDESVKPILSAFYTFLFRRLCAAGEHDAGSLIVRLLLDEFANLGEINNFAQVIAVARGYGVNISVVLQTLSQLRDLYGEAAARVIAGNCGLQLLLGTQDFETADIFSRALGHAAVRQRREHVTHTPGKNYLLRDADEISVRRSLLEPAEILQLPTAHGIALIGGKPPVLFEKINFVGESAAKKMLSCGVADVPRRGDVPSGAIYDLSSTKPETIESESVDKLFFF